MMNGSMITNAKVSADIVSNVPRELIKFEEGTVIQNVIYSPDGNEMAINTVDVRGNRRIVVVRSSDGKILNILDIPRSIGGYGGTYTDGLSINRFAYRGNLLAYSHFNWVRLWNPYTNDKASFSAPGIVVSMTFGLNNTLVIGVQYPPTPMDMQEGPMEVKQEVLVWDLGSNRIVHRKRLNHHLMKVIYSDSTLLGTGIAGIIEIAEDGTMHISFWNIKTGEDMSSIHLPVDVHGASWGPQGHLTALSGDDIFFYNPVSGEVIKAFNVAGIGMNEVSWSAKGIAAVTGFNQSGEMVIVLLNDVGQKLQEINVEDNYNDPIWSFQGDLATHESNRVYVFPLKTRDVSIRLVRESPIKTLHLEQPVKAIAFTRNQEHLIVALRVGIEKIQLSSNRSENIDPIMTATAASSSRRGDLAIGYGYWDQFGRYVKVEYPTGGGVIEVNDRLASLSYDKNNNLAVVSNTKDFFSIEVFSEYLSSSRFLTLNEWKDYGYEAKSSAYDPNNILAVALSKFVPSKGRIENHILMVNPSTDRILGNHYLPIRGEVQAITFSPEGELAVGTNRGEVTVWKWDSGKWTVRQTLTPRPRGDITSLVWGADGRLVAGFTDGRIIIWG